MYKIPKKNHTVEFKQEAIRQVEAEGKSAVKVARDLRIAEQTAFIFNLTGSMLCHVLCMAIVGCNHRDQLQIVPMYCRNDFTDSLRRRVVKKFTKLCK